MNSAWRCRRCRDGCSKWVALSSPMTTTPRRVRCAIWPPRPAPILPHSPGWRKPWAIPDGTGGAPPWRRLAGRSSRHRSRPEPGGGVRVPIPTSRWSPTSSRRRRQALRGSRPVPWPRQPMRYARHNVSGLPASEAAAAWRNCSITSFGCSGPILYGWLAARVPKISTSAPSGPATPLSSSALRPIRRPAYCRLPPGHPCAAPRGGSRLIAIADTITAPMAEGADHLLLFEAAASPGFFPSLTGAIAIAQSLAAVTFVLGGVGSKRRLEETELRLTAMSEYVAEKG